MFGKGVRCGASRGSRRVELGAQVTVTGHRWPSAAFVECGRKIQEGRKSFIEQTRLLCLSQLESFSHHDIGEGSDC